MTITNVTWMLDHQQRFVLRLRLDGQPAHIQSAQRVDLTRRGLVKGVAYFASEWRAQADHPFLRGRIEPGLTEKDLSGCTDDPEVFALYEQMCQAIRAGTWQPGPPAGSA